jgi:hypothetical protein
MGGRKERKREGGRSWIIIVESASPEGKKKNFCPAFVKLRCRTPVSPMFPTSYQRTFTSSQLGLVKQVGNSQQPAGRDKAVFKYHIIGR